MFERGLDLKPIHTIDEFVSLINRRENDPLDSMLANAKEFDQRRIFYDEFRMGGRRGENPRLERGFEFRRK